MSNDTSISRRRRRSERGEGNFRLILALALMAYVGYLGIQNVPTWIEVQSLKHDVEELARSLGVQGINEEKVGAQVRRLANNHQLKPEEFHYKKDGKNLTIGVETTKQVDLLFTKYDWKIEHEKTEQAW